MPHHHHKHAKRHAAKHRVSRDEQQPDKRDGILDFFDNLFGGDSSSKRDEDVEIIYITLEPDFDGPVGGYSTEGQDPDPPTNGIAEPIQRTKTSTKESEPTKTVTPTKTPTKTPTPRTTTTTSPRKTPSPGTTLATRTSELDFTPTAAPTLSTTAYPSETSAAETAATGLSGGAKAGIAIGVIAAVGLIAAAILLFLRKRKAENEGVIESGNEKAFTDTGAAVAGSPGPTINEPPPPPPVSKTPDSAPQLNVRHVSQFAPDFGAGNGSSAPSMLGVAGIAAATGAGAAVASRNLQDNQSSGPAPPQKPNNDPSNPFSDPVNPFGNHAAAPSPASPPPMESQAPIGDRNPSPEVPSVRTVTPETGVASTGMAVAAGAIAVAGAAGSNDKQHPQQHPTPPAPGFVRDGPPGSPALSDAASVASAGLAGGPPPGPNNVHRVQLDFSPSMEDELELRAGQLVRMIHEYDDGWALCVRLDRSQQGVAPRTCLSARPVKPRPRGPPGPPGPPRGPPPFGPNGRPMSPAGGRMSPGAGPHPNGPPRYYPGPNGSRPSSPSGYRPYPPNPNSRPASPSGGYRPYTPNGMQPPRFPDHPRSLSPGPGNRIPQQRSMSPGPRGMEQRQRSNSSSGPPVQIPQPPGPSALGGPVQGPVETPEAAKPVETIPPVQPVEQSEAPKPAEPTPAAEPVATEQPQPAEPVKPAEPATPAPAPAPEPAAPAPIETTPAPVAEPTPANEPAKPTEPEQQPIETQKPVQSPPPPSSGPITRKPVPISK